MTGSTTLLLISLAVSGLLFSLMMIVISRLRSPSPLERVPLEVLSPAARMQVEVEEWTPQQASKRERLLKPFFRRLQRIGERLTPAKNIERLQMQLVRANHPGGLSVADFLGLRVLVGILAGIVAFMATFSQYDVVMALLFTLISFIIGLYLPNSWLNRRVRARQKAIARALPDALDLMTICVEAGLGFEAAMQKVTEKWQNELSEELQTALNEIRLGVRRGEAMRHLAERVDVPEVSSFVAVIVQADRLGVPIGNVLHTQSAQMRMRRRQRAEEEAHKAPIKMLFPLVLFIFPALFAVILGPAAPRIVQLLDLG
ncbi:MAG: type II secretion system F family protein [Chloroflexi bacterium]|nr:type II secretion system F family protein [Chloroflexota bacterium]